MARTCEPEEVLEQFKEWLPEAVARLFHPLWHEVAMLNVGWSAYVELYEKGQERLELLEYSAEAFFDYLESAIFQDVLLSLARLTDPRKTGKWSNLTLRRLPGLLQRHGHSEVGEKVANTLSELIEMLQPIRDYRNQWLSHRDLKKRLGDAELRWGFSTEDVGRAIDRVNEILNIVEYELRKGVTHYSEVIQHGGPDHLVFALKQAREAEEREARAEGRLSYRRTAEAR